MCGLARPDRLHFMLGRAAGSQRSRNLCIMPRTQGKDGMARVFFAQPMSMGRGAVVFAVALLRPDANCFERDSACSGMR